MENNWISVKEKMPSGGDVLLLTTSKVVIIGDWYVDGWRTHRSHWEPVPGTTHFKLVHELLEGDVTHWQPLPQPPKN